MFLYSLLLHQAIEKRNCHENDSLNKPGDKLMFSNLLMKATGTAETMCGIYIITSFCLLFGSVFIFLVYF